MLIDFLLPPLIWSDLLLTGEKSQEIYTKKAEFYLYRLQSLRLDLFYLFYISCSELLHMGSSETNDFSLFFLLLLPSDCRHVSSGAGRWSGCHIVAAGSSDSSL